jgi:hypothetical protein
MATPHPRVLSRHVTLVARQSTLAAHSMCFVVVVVVSVIQMALVSESHNSSVAAQWWWLLTDRMFPEEPRLSEKMS